MGDRIPRGPDELDGQRPLLAIDPNPLRLDAFPAPPWTLQGTLQRLQLVQADERAEPRPTRVSLPLR